MLAILSPCCSIRDKVLLLAPLIALRSGFFDNPYLEEDLTRLNRRMHPEQSLPPRAWERLSPEERTSRLGQGELYAFPNLFVYAAHDLFPEYLVHRKAANVVTMAYMVDFRHTFTLNCDRVISPTDAPLESKLLELAIETRSELREKLASFYARVPEEERAAQP